jgi:hypothetical protein
MMQTLLCPRKNLMTASVGTGNQCGSIMFVPNDINERYPFHKKKSLISPDTYYEHCWMWDNAGGRRKWFHCLALPQE